MKFSQQWLWDWVSPPVNVDQLAERLTMIGLEVDAITSIGGHLSNVKIGQVLVVTPHPNADRLRICQVSLGDETTPLTIVCGAANVREGLKVAVALVDALLPGGLHIKRAKIRGIESCGMLCSAMELGLEEGADGILELANDAPIGKNFSEYMGLPDHVMEVNITPNRGDCLSIAGMAREVSVAYQCPLNSVDLHAIAATTMTTLPVHVAAADQCPRYIGRIIQGINPQANTPVWMQQRLQRSGIRVIHPVVDVNNYVMLELGQPLHAFDLSTISNEIQVRMSQAGETVTLLDGQTLSLLEPALVIADDQQILALAGIMGGVSSAVTPTTTDLFLESAFFLPAAVRSTLRRLPIHSDAAHRYERGVDPDLPLKAMQRATELLLAIVGGSAGPVISAEHAQYVPQPVSILLRKTRIKRILGVELDSTLVVDILQRLGMQIELQPEGWQVKVPTHRFDITIEVDLIEEIARIYGYDRLPSHTPQVSLTMQAVPEQKITSARLCAFLMDQGYSEAIHYSFVDAKLLQMLNPQQKPLALLNPMSNDMAVMRTSLWPGLLQSVLFNLNRQQTRVRLFEIGTCFIQCGEDLKQQTMIAGVVVGSAQPEQWGVPSRPVDFFDVKGDLETLLAWRSNAKQVEFVAATHPALHPSRTALLRDNDICLGYMGELHPQWQQQLGIQLPVYLFELNLQEALQAMLPRYVAPSKYPCIRRDLAFIVAEKISFEEIRRKIYSYANEALQSVQLFDIYRGPGIASEQKSIALGLTFQLASRTLVDEEIDEVIIQVINALKQDFSAILRE